MNKSIILLSGGLDSLVSVSEVIKYSHIELALTFNYGQKAYPSEYLASKKIAEYYKISHKVITLDFLKEITKTSLVSNDNIPELEEKQINNFDIIQSTMEKVWVPNRNGLFINIAASIAEANNINEIIIGANNEEGQTFKDNSKNFILAINYSLKNSTNNCVKVNTPLIELNKNEIVKLGMDNNAPMELIKSCYMTGEKHCGKCESCIRLKKALEYNNCYNLLKILF